MLALDELIDSCEPTQVKHMMQVIEPQFQRDFISLLPKEVRVINYNFHWVLFETISQQLPSLTHRHPNYGIQYCQFSSLVLKRAVNDNLP